MISIYYSYVLENSGKEKNVSPLMTTKLNFTKKRDDSYEKINNNETYHNNLNCK